MIPTHSTSKGVGKPPKSPLLPDPWTCSYPYPIKGTSSPPSQGISKACCLFSLPPAAAQVLVNPSLDFSPGLLSIYIKESRLPRWYSSKEPACQCRRRKRRGFYPRSGRFPWSRKWQPTPVFLPEKSYGQRSRVGYSPWGCKGRHDRVHPHAHREPRSVTAWVSVMAGLVSSNLETSGTISFKSAVLRGHQGRGNSGDLMKDPEEATCWARTTSIPILPPAPRVLSNLHFPQIPEHNNFPSLSTNEWAQKKKKKKKEMNGLKWASIAEKNKNCKTKALWTLHHQLRTDSPPLLLPLFLLESRRGPCCPRFISLPMLLLKTAINHQSPF